MDPPRFTPPPPPPSPAPPAPALSPAPFPPPGSAYPPPPAAPQGAPVDPIGLGAAVARLAPGSRRNGRVAIAVLSAVLDDAERVEVVVVGRVNGETGAAALTDRRVVVVNERQWRPDLEQLPLVADLAVQGWADDRTAALVFAAGGRTVTIDRVADRVLAQELAGRARHRVAALGGSPPPT
ncbi:hypothetical protein BH20ACT2_BH20ACT2_00250 [soil metagenome]